MRKSAQIARKRAESMFFKMYVIEKKRAEICYKEVSKHFGYSISHLKKIIPLTDMKLREKEYELTEK